jgi:hypothetical protein
MRCPNCNTEIADHLTHCWVCDSNLITLENYLNKKNKILVIIGVFGALSIYLLQTANTYNGNYLLQLGSGMSLLVMVVLSSHLILDCNKYIKKYPKNAGESDSTGYPQWIKHTTDLLYLYAFLAGLSVIVITVLLFMLLFSNINEIAASITFGFIFIFLFVAFILMPTDSIVRKENFFGTLFVIFLLSLMIFIWIGYLVKDAMKITTFTLMIDTTLIVLTSYGWYNAIDMTFKKADENWEFVRNFFINAF